ncbi:MAG: ATP-dependent helicase HrpB [Gemmobacter sp.]
MPDTLPIDAVLPDLIAALRDRGMAVLEAPPGAGKTTRVPLALLGAGLAQGRIVMLEPRRLAARAAAERMADTLGEPVGRSVGYRMRGEARVGPATRIEVVTEGILTRMIHGDASLPGVGAILFDEFHERSLNADLGLALALDIRAALRPDLILLPMSATLDAAPVAALMGDAPRLSAPGRAFPVETRWLPRPAPRDRRIEAQMADLILQALDEAPGGILAFLPGEGEIRRTSTLLATRLPGNCVIRPLFGALDAIAQRLALAPDPDHRKIVLATAIAETSLTIPDIRIVVDAGLARRARFDPASGMSRLVTERVTRAEATQRQGRAGRVAPGLCYRLWARAEEGALAAFPPPEIAAADLCTLALDLALWGSDDLAFLTPPPAPALAEARALLAELGALDARGRITAHGRALSDLPLHPRLGHMLLAGGGPLAADLAALLSDRDPLRGAPPDLSLRLPALRAPGPEADRPAIDRIRAEAARLRRLAPPDRGLSAGALAALAYPDRIGLRRKGDAPRWLLSGGRGAAMDAGLPLSQERLIVVTDLDGSAREARIRQAAPLTMEDIDRLHGHRTTTEDICQWDSREGRIVARRQRRLGSIVLAEAPWTDAPPEARALAAWAGLREMGLREMGLPWTPPAARLRARAQLARRDGADLPDTSDAALLAAPDWILPWLAEVRTTADLRALDLTDPLRGLLGHLATQTLDRLFPAHVDTPLGRRVAIDYDGETPAIEVRLQEMFGVTRHPTVGPQGTPLRITLLSPGGRPVQVTADLPGFWRNSYPDVRRDMRGRYPRHPWPEDPTQAEPTLRAKPRGT